MALDSPWVENVLMHEFAHKLDHVRTQARRLVLARATGLVLSVVLPTLLLLITTDWYWRFSTGTRWLLLVSWLTMVFLLCRRFFLPATRFHPSRLTMAHRLEQIHPSLRGHCVPVVGLEDTNQMASNSIQEASRLVSQIRVQDSLKAGPATSWFLLGLGSLVSIVVLSILLPSTTLTGSTRMLLPWLDARWPARTVVESLMDTTNGSVHGRGIPLLLRAANRTPGELSGEVWVTYRIQNETGEGEWRTDLLTDQGGGIHERMISSVGNSVEFRFHTEDASTATQVYTLVELPRILEAHITITPPHWASTVIPTHDFCILKKGRTFPNHQGRPSSKDHTFNSISRQTGPFRVQENWTLPSGHGLSLVGPPTDSPISVVIQKIQHTHWFNGQWRTPSVSYCSHMIPTVFTQVLHGSFHSIHTQTIRPRWLLSPHPTINQYFPRPTCLFPRQVLTTSVFHPWVLKFIQTPPPFTRDQPVPCGSSPGQPGEQQGLWCMSWTLAHCNPK